MALDSNDDITVTITVDGIEPDEQQQRVLDVYEENVETFLRKNENYGGSFENSAKLESIMRHGEVRHGELFDIIAEQILVRGFYDKLSRFHQLQMQDDTDLVGEDLDDTLLDMGNYAIMLAAMRRKYSDMTHDDILRIDSNHTWDEDDIEEFMEEYDEKPNGYDMVGVDVASDEK